MPFRSIVGATLLAPALFVAAALAPALPAAAAEGDAVEMPRLQGEPKIVFTDSTPDKMGQTRRVVITNVVLEFQTKVFAEQITGRLSKMYLKRGNTYSDNVLAGFDAKALEAAADQVYERLKADFAAAGFEVVSEADLQAQPAYQKLKESMGYPQGYHFGNREGHSLVIGPKALPIYLPPLSEQGTFYNQRQNKGEVQAPTLGMTDRMKFAGNSTYANGLEIDLAKALNAHVVKAWYLVGFGTATAETGFDAVTTAHYATTATSKTGARAQMYIREEESRLAVRHPDGDRAYSRESKRINAVTGGYRPYDGDVVVRLDETLQGPADFLAAGGVENATAERDQKAGLFGVLNSAVRSFNGTVSDQSYKTTVEPKRFADTAVAMISQLQPLLVAKLKP